MSSTDLRWCPGCQINVKPKMEALGALCPRCETQLGSSISRPRGIDIDDPKSDDDPWEIDIAQDLRSSRSSDLLGEDYIQTPASGRLTLNPKVKAEPRVPLCPDCEERIERVEHPNKLVEFRCGCDDLRYFEFPERDTDG